MSMYVTKEQFIGMTYDELLDENTKLYDENAKLREQVMQLGSDWESERDYADQMEAKEKRAVAENTKLRELVRDMWHDIPKSEACAWDSSANTCTGSDSCIGECSYWYRMVKLGIEMDE